MVGDARALEQSGLTAMHSLFLNEHNRLALLIYENYPHLSDEEIYQVVRKIVGAEMQNIVYNEFLPLVLGNDALEEFDLKLPNNAEENTNYVKERQGSFEYLLLAVHDLKNNPFNLIPN